MTHSTYFISTREYASYLMLRFAISAGDLMIVALSYGVAFLFRFHYAPFLRAFPVTKGYPGITDYMVAGPLILFTWAVAISWQGGYKKVKLPAIDEAIRIIKSSFLGTILSMSAMFLYRESSFSRLVFIFGGIFSCFFIYAYRQGLKMAYVMWVQRNRRPRRVLIIGNGYLSNSLQKILERHGDRAILKKQDLNRATIERTILRSRIHEVLIANPDVNHKEAIQLAGFCEERGIVCRLLPDILEMRMGEVLIDDSLGLPTFQLKPISLHGTAFLTKRFIDVGLASFVLGLLFLPLLIITLLIKITSQGPVLYKHMRLGYRETSFEFLKFRTMIQNAESLLENLKKDSDRPGPVFKMKNDPRITFIGRFLRRYSIDEIPQLLNVLRGEMSLVGPRPQVLWETKAYNDWARKRLNVLPGVTGLWQVSGRAELTYQEMIDLDIFYIEHWTPGLDMKILMKTLPAVLFGKGAY